MSRQFVRPVVSLIVLVLVAPTFAQEAKPRPPKSEVKNGVKIERDIAYVPNGDDAQRLDLYLPEKPSDKPLPLLVWVHGGGWRGGNKDGNPGAVFVRQGYATASVEYRMSQKALFPAQIQDCQAAVRFLRANAKQYNIDPDRIAVWGGSAGGHLVALLGTAGGKNAFPKIGGNDDVSDRVQAVVDIYGPADFSRVKAQAAADTGVKYVYDFEKLEGNPYAMLIGAKFGESPEKEKAVSPVSYVSKDNPPILILHGTADPHVPFAQSVEFADALKKAGVEVVLQPLPGAGHGGPQFNLPPIHNLTKAFFDKHLKGADVKIEVLSDEQVTLPPPAGAPPK